VTASGRSWSALIKNSTCEGEVATSFNNIEVDTRECLWQRVRCDDEN